MLETSRLRLRRLHASDEADLVELDRDPLVMRYVGSPRGVRTHEETVERVRQRIHADHGAGGWWIIEDKHDGAFHGVGLLLGMPEGDDVEVGYRLARRSWGRGIATEAAAALIDHAFAALRVPRMVAVVYPDNHPSRRVLSKLGFAHDGPREYRGARVEHYTLAASAWRALRVDNRGDAPA
ncbi:MAG TPA: GNAT family N-acetyltransferase [Candidatus Methylomirabilis sp.]|nr:GNAT family N-acetyltransferase [Candidatus Methylomirabilis sp.]